MRPALQRIAVVFLFCLPFLAVVLASVRALRVPSLYPLAGAALFAVTLGCAWIVGLRSLVSADGPPRRAALAGGLLLAPWALIVLLWIGIGAPFQATLAENHHRFLLLICNALLVSAGFVALHGALAERGERFWSTLGFATSLPAGAAYFICLSLSAGQTAAALYGERAPLPLVLDNFYNVVEFVACVLTYASTAAFALALGAAGWLGTGAARTYAIVSAVFVLLLAARGIAYPEISGHSAPWYTQPGVIAGIPAIPWLMPGLLGAVLLRRAGNGGA